MKALYPGRCAATAQPINPGDEVRSVGTSSTGRTLWALVNPPGPAPAPYRIGLASASHWRASQRRRYPNAPE